jgi:hypothetical protein
MSVPLLLEMQQNLSMWIFVWFFAKDFQQIIIYHLWADKVAGESWQLVIAIDVEGDGLILCEWHSEGYDTCSCHLVFGFTSPGHFTWYKPLNHTDIQSLQFCPLVWSLQRQGGVNSMLGFPSHRIKVLTTEGALFQWLFPLWQMQWMLFKALLRLCRVCWYGSLLNYAHLSL